MDVVNTHTSMASSHDSAVVSLLEPPLPIQIQLEPTTVCNLDCIMCPINSLQRDKNMMTLDEFKDLVGRFPKLERITMHGIGVSGGSAEQDERCAAAGLAAIGLGDATAPT